MSAAKSKSPKKIAEETNPDFQLNSIGNYTFVKTLGEGNFAKVKLAKHKMTGQEVAVKIIDKTQLDEKKIHKLYREVRIMKSLHHPNIVRLYEVIETRSTVFLVMEYSSGGELYDYLVVHGRMKEKEARAKFRQILSAVSYCHKKRVIHRDLKAENLLLDANLDIKIADFGFSNQYDPEGKLDTFCGSPPYAAPELFQGRRYVGPEVDIWSLGVILYVLTTGCLPFDGKNLQEMRESVCRGKYRIPFYLSDPCEKTLRKFLVKDATKRASLDIVLDDPWLNEGYTEPPVCTDLSMKILEDDNLIKLLEQKFHIARETILKSLRENLYDDISALYYLMYHERDRTGDYSRVQKVLSEATLGSNASSRSFNETKLAASGSAATQQQQQQQQPHTLQHVVAPASESAPSSTAAAGTTHAHADSSAAAAGASKPQAAASAGEEHAGSGVKDAAHTAAPAPHRSPIPQQRASSTAPRRRRFTMGNEQAASGSNSNAAGTGTPGAPEKGGEPFLGVPGGVDAAVPHRVAPKFDTLTTPRPATTAAGVNAGSPTGSSLSGGGVEILGGTHISAAHSSTSSGGGAGGSSVTASSAVSHASSGGPSSSVGGGVQAPHTSALVPGFPDDASDGIRKRNNTIVGILRNTIARTKASETSVPENTLPSPMASPVEEGKPRSLRFTFNSNTTSTKPPDEMVQSVLDGCTRNHIQPKLISRYLLECAYTVPQVKDIVRFEVEICKLPRLKNLHGLRFKRVSGASNDYKQICEQLLQSISL